MIHAQNNKPLAVLAPASVATNATATANIDTLGYDYATIDVLLDSSASTTNNPAVLQIAESDDTVVTNFATFTGSVGDTDFTIPAVSATLPTVVRLNVDCRARKRYLRLSLTTAGAAMIVGATASLSRADEAVTSATTGSDAEFNM